MKRICLWVIILLIAMCSLTGCYDRLDMEDASLALLLGIDMDKDNHLLLYDIYPIFEKNVKKPNHEITVAGDTFRQTRTKADSFSAGTFQARKAQVMLISKKVLQHPNWFQLLDVFFRDAKNPLTIRMIAYDGPLSEIIHLNPKDQPMLPMLLRKMIDTKSARSETVNTTIQDLHWQIFEKGITPSISEVGLGHSNEVRLLGTALLDRKGKYILSLDAQETVLLSILQDHTQGTVSLTLPIPGVPKTGPLETNRISFSSDKVKSKIKTTFQNGKFRFDFHIQMPIGISEVLYPISELYTAEQLEQIISKQAQKQFEGLIRIFQEHAIDPIGMGRYARAYHYNDYKKIQEIWSSTFAKSEVHITVKASIQNAGPVKY
ncbi:Ger(x)C family spore germination protein [Paenibacillus sp. UNC451MF]|uniref:Ger(x)C family spore germination protein n=1 Tax=Paenibacillus sp. UNC451MF TaxID=1449063 RepID=UPI00048D5336|nr:Ger(x)C family spore germination protein [Paenibacillus sp. UNC451MF]